MSDSESDYRSELDSSFGEAVSKLSSSRTATPQTSSSTLSVTSSSGNLNRPRENASDQYKKLSQLEHILIRPDTYIGSVEKTPMEMWCFDAESEQMVYKEVTIVPGLYKIFDEILVNAADNKIRDPTMKNIKVVLDPENNLVEVMNDGSGIPIEIHKTENIYIPELIFGNLLTSSNYNDDEKKVTGGRNGYGAKLCNIFSTEFTVETADLHTGKLYKQTWSNNMLKFTKPKITALKTKKEYTKITFKPDLSRFGMEKLDDQILSVMRRRVYDLCGTVKDCNIYLNGKKINIKNFKSYVEMYVKAIKSKQDQNPEDEKKFTTIVQEAVNDRWEIAFAVSDGNFNQVSFVNSIATTSGGTHIKYISDQIVTKLVETISKKEGKGKNKLMIRPQEVRNNMFLFVNCLVENPAFTSQTKEQLTTKVTQFGGKPSDKITITDNFIARILKTSIVEKIREIASRNEDKALLKEDGSRKLRVKGQVKLVDANRAGTKDGYKCTLILTEGDSALSLAVAGLAVVGRDYYGCFPLRGKLLNVREALTEQVAKNAEITALKQIMGLQHKKNYNADNIKNLRYGHVMIMTDQDTDGSHIKGLLINFFESTFPGLLEVPGFLLEFITPIVKVTIAGRQKRVIPFYNMLDFAAWREGEGTQCRWTQKYYKGLGTSTQMEYIEYFTALDRHLKKFHSLQGDDSPLIDLAFSKKKADDRKDWLQQYVPGTRLDPELNEIPISEFINKELILFSMADNVRSIPSVLDGFKPGQRKVLFGCFKRNLRGEIKVASLAGYVSENTGYHHGEQSLVQTIIGLAQNFIGSNNMNVLKPIGAFGTRAAGGKDSSAARYIFTGVSDISRIVFNALDNPVLTYVQDDEKTVEPEWYLPIIPMLLVNGTEGIGTGWSTNIPPYNPVDIVSNIRKMMNGEPLIPMDPWFRGWEGELEKNGSDRYKVFGKVEQLDETTLEITELPIKLWTNNMKEFLLQGLGTDKVKAWIKDFEEHHSLTIRFLIKLTNEEMAKALKIGLLEKFKLIQSLSISNMVAFDPLGRIKRYDSPEDILKDFYYIRMEYYQRRKDYMADDLQNQLTKISEQARFIKMIIDGQLSISNKKRALLVEILEKFNFVRFDKSGKQIKSTSSLVKIEEDEDDDQNGISEGLFVNEEVDEANVTNKPETIYSSYDYLLGMSIWTLTRERYEKLLKQRDNVQEKFSELLGKSAKDLWNEDLDEFLIQWEKFLEEDVLERARMKPMKASSRKGSRGIKRPAPSKANGRTEKNEPPQKKGTATKSKSKSKSPPIKKESKQQKLTFDNTDDASPDYAGEGSNKKAVEKQDKKKIISIFSESEDDELLGGSHIYETSKSHLAVTTAGGNSGSTGEQGNKAEEIKKTGKPRKSTPTVGSKLKAMQEELDDLEFENKEVISSRRNQKKPSVKYQFEYKDDDEDEDEDIEMASEEDDYSDEYVD